MHPHPTEPAPLLVEALFASALSAYTPPTPQQARHAVRDTILRLGAAGCVAVVAAEFGDHPDTAVPRMCWCRQVARVAYPNRHPHRALSRIT